MQLEHDNLVNAGLKLKNLAIERVIREADDAVSALEVVSLATHTGKGSPLAVPRRGRESNPLETLAIRTIEKRLESDPMDELDRILDRRERLEDAADHLSGGKRRRESTGDTIADTLAAIADTELGKALGASLGMRLISGQAPSLQTPQTVEVAQGSASATPPPSEALPMGTTSAPEAGTPSPSASAPRPTSIRVGIALRMLRSMTAEQAARWLWDNAEGDDLLGQLLDSAVATDPEALPAFLEAVCAEASADPQRSEWLPLLQELRDNRVYALALHASLRAIAAAEPPLEQAATQ